MKNCVMYAMPHAVLQQRALRQSPDLKLTNDRFVKTNGCYLIKGSYKSFTTRKYQNQTRLNQTEIKQKNIDLRTNKNSNSYTEDPKDAVYV